MSQIPPTILIQAQTLPEAWEKALGEVLTKGLVIGTQYGNKSIDACSVIEVTKPYLEPMLHPKFPTKDKHMQEYLKQWTREYDWKRFEYTYMNRFIAYPSTPNYANEFLRKYYTHCEIEFLNEGLIDQLSKLKYELSKGITSRRLQMITWIPDRDLFVKEDQPCLQRLWFRIVRPGEVEMHAMWRSRDLFAAWNSNLVGLLTMAKRELFEPNNLKLVKYVDFCNALHIYEADWMSAREVIKT